MARSLVSHLALVVLVACMSMQVRGDCTSPEACPSSNACAIGYAGTLCASCAPGYVSKDNGCIAQYATLPSRAVSTVKFSGQDSYTVTLTPVNPGYRYSVFYSDQLNAFDDSAVSAQDALAGRGVWPCETLDGGHGLWRSGSTITFTCPFAGTSTNTEAVVASMVTAGDANQKGGINTKYYFTVGRVTRGKDTTISNPHSVNSNPSASINANSASTYSSAVWTHVLVATLACLVLAWV